MNRGVPPGDPSTSEGLPVEEPGTVLGHYRLVEAIGEGGFGTVFRAEQTEPVQRQVALKVIKLGMDTRQVVARFEAERQALALMDHPSIARVYDAGATATGRPYFVMELVQGEPITTFCDREQLSTDERLALFRQVCLAVQHAHQKGVLHRDLKPSNILVTRVDGEPVPKVIDFGIAKAMEKPLTDSSLATEEFQVMGTPEYMPPEQAAARDVDTRADVYSLGVVLYELLTGTCPFTRTTAGFDELHELLRKINEVTPPKPSTRASELGGRLERVAHERGTAPGLYSRSLRGDLDWICMKALEKERERRYATALELADDVARHLANEPVVASPPSRTYRLRKFVRRNRLLVGASAVVAATLLVSSAGLVWGFLEVRRERDAADVARGKETEAREAAELALAATEEARREETRAREAERKAREAAEESLEESDEVTRFLEDMLGSIDPERDGLEITVRQILDRSADSLEQRFASKPRVHARLARTLGVTYKALGLPRASEPFLESALRIVRTTLEPTDPLFASALVELGRLRFEQRSYEQAELLWLEAIESLEKADQPAKVATARGNLGYLYVEQGRLEDAERELLLAVEGLRSSDAEHARLLTQLENLAVLYERTGRLGEASELTDQIYAGYLADLGPEHPNTLRVRRNRLTLMRSQLRSGAAAGGLEEILEETRALLALSRRVLGPAHPETVEVMIDIAEGLDLAGRHREGAELYGEVVAALREIHGERHPSVGTYSAFLGIAFWQSGRLSEAESVLADAVDLLDETLGPEHSDATNARNVLAIVHWEQGRPEHALASWQQLLAIQEQQEHPIDAFRTRLNIGMVQRDLGLYDEAETIFVEALESDAPWMGPESELRQAVLNNLAILYMNTHRLDEAQALDEHLIEIRERRLGPDHPLTMGTLVNLAVVFTFQGRDADAMDVFRDVLERRVQVLGPEHQAVGDVLQLMGDCLRRMGELGEAEERLRAALAVHEKELLEDSPQLLTDRHGLGLVLRDAGQLEEAEVLLSRVWEARRQGRPGHEDIVELGVELAGVLRKLERDEEALQVEGEIE